MVVFCDIWIVLEDRFLFQWRYIIAEGFTEFTFHWTPVFLKAIQRNTQTPGQPWKGCWKAEAMQTEQRTYWEQCWEHFARAGHCVTHLLSGHLGLVGASNTRLPPITSLEAAKLGIPNPALRQEPNCSLAGKWSNPCLSHFLQTHFWHLYSVSAVASGPYLEFENFSSKE